MGKLVAAHCGCCKRNIPIREMGAKTKCPTCRQQQAQLAQKALPKLGRRNKPKRLQVKSIVSGGLPGLGKPR